MKRVFSCILFLMFGLFLTGCSYEEIANDVESEGDIPTISVSIQQWSAVIDSEYGIDYPRIKLRLYGTTNCERVTVITYENGKSYEVQTGVTNGKIDFTKIINTIEGAKLGDSINQTTVIKGYLGTSVKEITLNSGSLIFK